MHHTHLMLQDLQPEGPTLRNQLKFLTPLIIRGEPTEDLVLSSPGRGTTPSGYGPQLYQTTSHSQGRWFADASRRGSPICPKFLSCRKPTGCANPIRDRTGVILPRRPKGYRSDYYLRLTSHHMSVMLMGARFPVPTGVAPIRSDRYLALPGLTVPYPFGPLSGVYLLRLTSIQIFTRQRLAITLHIPAYTPPVSVT
jgi:hypothetical protein